MNLTAVDHLIYAVPDLADGIDALEQQLGVRAAIGGRHPTWGTHNALLSLGPACYLEIIAADPDASTPTSPRPAGLDTLTAPRLATWVAAATDLARRASDASRAGVDLGAVARRSRQRPDGSVLSWTMTDPTLPRMDGLVPFLIDWTGSPHPGGNTPGGCRLLDLRAEHPEPDRVRHDLTVLGLDLSVSQGREPRLVAELETPNGRVELA